MLCSKLPLFLQPKALVFIFIRVSLAVTTSAQSDTVTRFLNRMGEGNAGPYSWFLHPRGLAGRDAMPTKSVHIQAFLESWNFYGVGSSSQCGSIGKLIKQIACKKVNIKIVCKNACHHLCCLIQKLYLSQIDFQIIMLININ